MGKKYYNQRDYTGKKYAGYPFQDYACCPTSCAMLGHAKDSKQTPLTAAKIMEKAGKAGANGSSWDAPVTYFKEIGMEAIWCGKEWHNYYGTKGSDAEKEFKNYLKKGWSGIIDVGKSIYTTGGHFIAIWDIKKADGTYYYNIQDPYSRSLCGWHTWDSLSGKVKFFVAVKDVPKYTESTHTLSGYTCGRKYRATSDRPIREKPSTDATWKTAVTKNDTVVFSKLRKTTKYLWGRIGKKQWVCIKRLDKSNIYFATINTKKVYGYKVGKKYKTVSNRPVRLHPYKTAKKLSTYKKGKVVVFDKLTVGQFRTWGKIKGKDEWVCIMRNDKSSVFVK